MVQQTFTFFYSIVNDNSPKYLKAELSQPKVYNYSLRSDGVFESSYVETQRSGNTFFLYCIREWNELHVSIRTATTLSQFKNELIKCIRPPKRSTFKIDDILGIKLITRISLGLYTFNDRSNQLILLGAMTFIRLPEHFKIDDPSP